MWKCNCKYGCGWKILCTKMVIKALIKLPQFRPIFSIWKFLFGEQNILIERIYSKYIFVIKNVYMRSWLNLVLRWFWHFICASAYMYKVTKGTQANIVEVTIHDKCDYQKVCKPFFSPLLFRGGLGVCWDIFDFIFHDLCLNLNLDGTFLCWIF